MATAVVFPAAWSTMREGSSSDGGSFDLRRLDGKEDDMQDDEDDMGTCATLESPGAQIIVLALGLVYMFCALAIVCDEYFVPALEVISEKWELKDDVAGATLMAAGGSAPELFTSLIGTFNTSDVGIGTIVGSAVFNVMFVIGMCAVFSSDLLQLTWWPLARDCAWYIVALLMTGGFFANGDGSTIVWWEAVLMFLVYVGYVTFMRYNEDIERYVKNQVLPYSWGMSEMAPPDLADGESGKGAVLGDLGNTGFAQPTRFRAGIVKLLLTAEFEVDNLGVHAVGQIQGTAAETFAKVDKDKDGMLGPGEVGARPRTPLRFGLRSRKGCFRRDVGVWERSPVVVRNHSLRRFF